MTVNNHAARPYTRTELLTTYDALREVTHDVRSHVLPISILQREVEAWTRRQKTPLKLTQGVLRLIIERAGYEVIRRRGRPCVRGMDLIPAPTQGHAE